MGDVFGPNSAVADDVVAFGGPTGKIIADSGLSIAMVSASLTASISASGDTSGSLPNLSVVRLQSRSLSSTAPVKYQQIGSNDSTSWAPMYATQPCGSVEVTLSSSTGSVDGTVFTVPPACAFLLTMVLLRVSTTVSGSGSVALRVGTTTGGSEIITDITITSASFSGSLPGETLLTLSTSSMGSSMSASNGYAASLNANNVIKVRATTSGSISANNKVACYAYGLFLP